MIPYLKSKRSVVYLTRKYGIGWHIQKEHDENIHLLKISLLVQIGAEL